MFILFFLPPFMREREKDPWNAFPSILAVLAVSRKSVEALSSPLCGMFLLEETFSRPSHTFFGLICFKLKFKGAMPL